VIQYFSRRPLAFLLFGHPRWKVYHSEEERILYKDIPASGYSGGKIGGMEWQDALKLNFKVSDSKFMPRFNNTASFNGMESAVRSRLGYS